MHSADSQGPSSFHLGKVDIPLGQIFLGRKKPEKAIKLKFSCDALI